MQAIAEPFVSEVPKKMRNIAGETYAQHGRLSPLGKNPRTGYSETGKRNKRDVWVVPTSPYKEAHFATFPPKLIEPCVLAGCPVNGLVLDPFGGSGTTARVAIDHGRRAVLLDINYKDEPGSYLEMAKNRILAPAKPVKVKKEKNPPQEINLFNYEQLSLSC